MGHWKVGQLWKAALNLFISGSKLLIEVIFKNMDGDC